MAKLTKNQEHYWKGVADGRKEDEKRIAELESQLAALDWSPITQDNLPKLGDEVMRLETNRPIHVYAVSDEYNSLPHCQAREDTHRRPINAPAPPHTGAGG